MTDQYDINEVAIPFVNDKIKLDTKKAIALFIGFLVADVALYFSAKIILNILNSGRLTDTIYVFIRIYLSFYLIWYLNKQNICLGNTLRLRPVKYKIILPVLLFCIGFSFIAICAKNIMNLFIGTHSRSLIVNSMDFSVIITLIGLCLIFPFWEELTNRGLLGGALEPRYGKWTGILITSLIFAFFHYNPITIYFAFFLGLGLGWIASETGSIFPSILIHVLFNLSSLSRRISSIGDEIFITRSIFTYESIPIIIAVVLFVVGTYKLLVCRNTLPWRA